MHLNSFHGDEANELKKWKKHCAFSFTFCMRLIKALHTNISLLKNFSEIIAVLLLLLIY